MLVAARSCWTPGNAVGGLAVRCNSSTAGEAGPNPRKRKPQPDDKAHAFAATLRLPATPFPLRADAGKREKLFRKRTTVDLYSWQKTQTARPLFVLHDGPPYANGNLHIGHALNKILKDIINRSRLLTGHRVHYLPGWDTHGLPLELKALSALKKPARMLSPQTIRAAARAEAEKGVEVQRVEFREFGLLGEWGATGPGTTGGGYRTMDWSYERRQLGVVREMVRKGLITTHNKPTLYSPSSRTALAEAELEYNENHISRSVYVSFPIVERGGLAGLLFHHGIAADAEVLLGVWTTTAWTLPGNVAIAVSESMTYSLVKNMADGNLLVIASERIAALSEILSAVLEPLASFPGTTLLSTTYRSVLSSTAAPRPVFPAPYVTSVTGTGLVHTSPAHGVEDFEAWRAFTAESGLKQVPCAVDADGKFSTVLSELVDDEAVVERLIGKEVLSDGSGEVIDILVEKGRLLKEVECRHKFPYDWRTKKPVIFRATSQWFANLEKIKDTAISALDDVKFHPASGLKRLEIFVKGRSEWCISRQRAWGVPLPVLYSYTTSPEGVNSLEVAYLTPSSIDHIISVLEAKSSTGGGGTDYWWEGQAEEFVEPEVLAQSRVEGRSWRKGTDTLDVWFDSGCSWTVFDELALRPAPEGVRRQPFADVYLEGSDQHRGWFQSSLLTAISSGEEGKEMAPYGTVITHGMVLDEAGRKMSKSLGNVISPLVVINGGKNLKKEPAYGADLLRLWVASVDSSRDVPIGPGILVQTSDSLRKIRNTARFMLGNLSRESKVEKAHIGELGLIERYVLNELYTLDKAAKEAYDSFAFNRVYQGLITFTNTTLSAFYFDIIKDSLYADSTVSSHRRRSIVYTLQQILNTYTSILAPITPHLAEEIHHFSTGGAADPTLDIPGSSVFERVRTPLDPSLEDAQAKLEMDTLVLVRNEVMGLMEKARVDKKIGGSVEVEVRLFSDQTTGVVARNVDCLKDLFIVSAVTLAPPHVELFPVAWSYESVVTIPTSSDSIRIAIVPASLTKCPRCWTHTREVDAVAEVCVRCEAVLQE